MSTQFEICHIHWIPKKNQHCHYIVQSSNITIVQNVNMFNVRQSRCYDKIHIDTMIWEKKYWAMWMFVFRNFASLLHNKMYCFVYELMSVHSPFMFKFLYQFCIFYLHNLSFSRISAVQMSTFEKRFLPDFMHKTVYVL